MTKSLKQALKSVRMDLITPRKTPLWKGPEVDGVTQSMLSRFLCCPERFRLLMVEGWGPTPQFNARMEYGTMWHLCEEHCTGDWRRELKRHAQELVMRYPTQGSEVEKWFSVCCTQFPIYLEYWSKHPDVKCRKVLLPETVFSVPYELGSGRTVRLRGRWDSVDLIGKGREAGLYLQENKTKADINEMQMATQLQFDLQTMLYLVALEKELEQEARDGFPKGRVCGVRYNVVRRPLSGGLGSIRPHQATKNKPAETPAEFQMRLASIIREQPETFFMRWRVEILPADLERFKKQFLDPILERLWDWWEWITADLDDPWRTEAGSGKAANGIHFRFPFGVWNPALEGRSGELDEYLATGSTLGLSQCERLFRELD